MSQLDDYYKSCPIPKPATNKKKVLFNGYKNKKERRCQYCNTPNAERHEVFRGTNRQLSIREGFQINLCSKCHLEVTENTAKGKAINSYWERYYQKKYIEKLMENGMSEEDALKVWMDPRFIGKNYL